MELCKKILIFVKKVNMSNMNWWNKSTRKNDHIGKSGTNGELIIGIFLVLLLITVLAISIL